MTSSILTGSNRDHQNWEIQPRHQAEQGTICASPFPSCAADSAVVYDCMFPRDRAFSSTAIVHIRQAGVCQQLLPEQGGDPLR